MGFAARFDSGQIPQVGRCECRFVEVAIHDALGFEESVAFDDASLLELLHIGDAEPDDIELAILFLDRSFWLAVTSFNPAMSLLSSSTVPASSSISMFFGTARSEAIRSVRLSGSFLPADV